MRYFMFLSLTLFLFLSAALAQEFRDGYAAFEKQDYQNALKLWLPLAEPEPEEHEKAGRLGLISDLRTKIGWMYENGKGVLQDSEQAVKWYEGAADLGSFEAAENLANMYLLGRSIKQSDADAYYWFRLHAKLLHGLRDFPCGECNEIAPKLTEKQINEIEERLSKWKPRHAVPVPLGGAEP